VMGYKKFFILLWGGLFALNLINHLGLVIFWFWVGLLIYVIFFWVGGVIFGYGVCWAWESRVFGVFLSLWGYCVFFKVHTMVRGGFF
ncbi:hypothetical protein, partial [Erwinia amylovora]|uniref:hypothetical protein n=1 Tax=Erwinia amylovora TaxID=552 RepID=UPI0020BF9B91